MKLSKVLLGLFLFSAACTNSPERETPKGFKFRIEKEGDGKPAAPGQYVVFEFFMKDQKDSVWADSYKRGFPEVMKIGDSSRIALEDEISQMMRMLSKGDSATFSISVKKLFEEMAHRPVPPGIDSTNVLHYSLVCKEILNQEEYQAYESKMEKEFLAKQEEIAKEQLGKDTVILNNYLAEKGIKTEKLPSGLQYVITKKGNGPTAESGKKVSIDYAGYLLDGTCFDTSIKSVAEEKGIYNAMRQYKPIDVVVDQTSVIQGWHQGLKQLNEGTKATLYIPSTLAYGSQARGDKIKENSILVFDVELLDVE